MRRLRYTLTLAVLSLTLNVHATDTLPGMLAEVMSTHPSLRSQRSLGEAAKAGIEGARWQFYPTPSVSVEQVSTGSRDTLYGGDSSIAVLRLQQPIWTGGRLSANLNKAEATALVAQAELESTRQQLAVRLVQAWGEAVVAHVKLKAYEQSVKTHIRLLEQVRRRSQDGFSSQSDIDLARARLDATQAEVSNTLMQQDTARTKLANLIGQPLASDWLPKLVDPSTIGKELQGQPLSLLTDWAWRGSPLRVRSEAQAQQAQADIAVAKAALWPEVYLRAERQQGNYVTAGTVPQNRFFLGLATTLGAGLSAQTTVDAARAREIAAREDLQTQQLAVVEQVQVDYAMASAVAQRRVMLQRSLEANADVLASWERQFLAGRKQWQDLMNAAREQAGAEAQLADTLGAEVVARWRLLLVTQGIDAVLEKK